MDLGEDLGYPAIFGIGDGIAEGEEWWHRFAITRRGEELLQAYREVYYRQRLVRLERERVERMRREKAAAAEQKRIDALYYSRYR